MGTDYCAYHGEREPITPDTYKVCGECLHAWQTEDEFVKDCRRCAEAMDEGVLKGWGTDLNAGRHAMIDAFAELTTIGLRAGVDPDEVTRLHGDFFDGNVNVKHAEAERVRTGGVCPLCAHDL
jgi:hypothetical protein